MTNEIKPFDPSKITIPEVKVIWENPFKPDEPRGHATGQIQSIIRLYESALSVLREERAWIPVEALPDAYPVLAIDETGTYGYGIINSPERWDAYVRYYTHWQLLPTPPTQEAA